MKASIDVKDRNEADRIKTALADDTVRTFVNVMGSLLPLGKRDQKRVLAFVRDKFADDEVDASESKT